MRIARMALNVNSRIFRNPAPQNSKTNLICQLETGAPRGPCLFFANASNLTAMARRGPNTPRGKAASSRNATTHGLTSDAPVIPGESREEWRRFLAGIIADWEPVGQFETEHAATIALLMWRRRRVARYEVASITANMQ